MKLNTILIDPSGRQARLITQPIPGRDKQLVTLLYADGHARLVDLAQCTLPQQQQTTNRSNLMSTTTKTPYVAILPVALHLVAVLGQFCTRLELAGSLRRGRPLVGDIELVAIPVPRRDLFGHPIAASTALDTFLRDRVALAKDGPRYKQFVYRGHTVDLFLPTEATWWGSVFTIRTGSAAFSHWLVTTQPHGACPHAVAFIDGRLHAHGRPLHTPEELDVFHALGLVYIEPDQRVGPLPHAARIDPVWNYE